MDKDKIEIALTQFACVIVGTCDKEVFESVMSNIDCNALPTLLQQKELSIALFPIGARMYTCEICGTTFDLDDDETPDDLVCVDCEEGPMCRECAETHVCNEETED